MRASEFEAFLRLVDGELSRDTVIVIVGGAAVAKLRCAVKANERLSLWELDDGLRVKQVA